MRHTDLELYRWKWHHDVYVHTIANNSSMYSWFYYWVQYGAFVSVLPRQAGKSTMLTILIKNMVNENEDYRVIAPNRQACRTLCWNGIDYKKTMFGHHINKHSTEFRGLNFQNTNLLVDEFTRIGMKNNLMHALDHPWKTVTMVSSL